MMALANHLWQSTLCLLLAAGLVRLLRHNAARWRHLVWLAASFKFLVPFSWLLSLGAQVPHPVVEMDPAPPAIVLTAMGEPFGDSTTVSGAAPVDREWLGATLPTIWAAGVLLLLAARIIRWRRFRRQLHAAELVVGDREQAALARVSAGLGVRTSIDLLSTGTLVEPGVVGIVRPAILWPVALSDRLSDRQLEAVFAHEVAHVRRRDNLAAALHRAVEVVFWFYPVVWLIESRLVRERERACDEAVLRMGHEPRAYARGILKVSTFCLQSASRSMAGATGANLTKRVEDIMSAGSPTSMSATRRVLLTAIAIAVITGPLAVGYVQAAAPTMPNAQMPEMKVRASHVRLKPDATYTGRTFRSAVTPADTPVAPQTASRVSGTVTDQRGAAVADATVTATPIGGSNGVSATTDASGRYVLDLQPAQYELRVGKPGFRLAQSALFVNRESPVTRDIQLQVGGVTESINVAGPDPSKPASDYLERAKVAYDAGLFAEAERMMSYALIQMRTENLARTKLTSAGTPGANTGHTTAPNGAVRVGGDIKEPKKIRDVRPVYPAEALAAHVTGIVILETTIGQDGVVTDAKVLRGQPLLNQAALDAVLQWQFTPTLLNGAPVEVLMTVTVNFTLQ